MATSDSSPETSSDRGTRMAKARSNVKAFANHNAPRKQKFVNIVIEENPQPQIDESEKGRNRLRMEQVQINLKVFNQFYPTKLGGSWLHDMLPEKPQRKLRAAVHRFEDRAFFILATKPLPPRGNITSAGGYEQRLRSLREKKWSPNDIIYVFTKNERWVTKDEATQPVIDTMKNIMEHYPEPLSRVPFRWMKQLYTSCVLTELPDPYRSGALVLPELDWAASRDAIQVNLDIPAFNTMVSVQNEPCEYPRPLTVDIGRDVAEHCAELEFDPIFRFRFSKDAEKKATNAQKGLAKLILTRCAESAMNQGEAMTLAQTLISQFGEKRKNRSTGKFRGKNMVVPCDLQYFEPSWLLEESCPDLPDIYVGGHATQSDWRFHIAQAAHIRFTETGNATEAWEAACETADILLDFGRELLFLPCAEADTEKAHTLHACYGCWFVWPCAKLQNILNRRYCPLCIKTMNFTETLRKEALPHWAADLAPLPPDGTIPQMQSVTSFLDEATDRSIGDGPDNADDREELGEELVEKPFYSIDSDEEQPRVVQSKRKDHSIKQGQQKGGQKVQQKGQKKRQQKGQQEHLQKPLKQTSPLAKKHSRPLTSESTAEFPGIRKGFLLASSVEEDAPNDGPLSIKEQREKAYDTLSGKKDAREERTALRQRMSTVRAELKEELELLDSLAKREQELTDFIEKS